MPYSFRESVTDAPGVLYATVLRFTRKEYCILIAGTFTRKEEPFEDPVSKLSSWVIDLHPGKSLLGGAGPGTLGHCWKF